MNEIQPISSSLETASIPPDEAKSYLCAYQAAWCLRRLLKDATDENSVSHDDSVQRLFESSGNVNTQSPRNGFSCFSEGCPVVVDDGHSLVQAPEVLDGCKYEGTPEIAPNTLRPIAELGS